MADLVLHGKTALDACVAAVARDAGATAVFCDIDGTISPIVADPYAAAVPEEFRAALAALAPRLGLLAFVTGREVSDGPRIIPIAGATYVGTHGMEVLSPDGTRTADPDAVPYTDAVQQIVRRAEALDRGALGIITEDKHFVLSIHYRLARDEAATRAIIERELLAPARDLGLSIATGHFLYEVRPPVSASKGTATAALLAAGDYRTAIFFGDDLTDCTGFAALRAWAEEAPARLACSIAALTDETPQLVKDESDVWVAATPGVLDALRRLVAATD